MEGGREREGRRETEGGIDRMRDGEREAKREREREGGRDGERASSFQLLPPG